MKPFEFVLVIISVVLGTALTEFAIVIAHIIQNYRIAVLSYPYLAILLLGLAAGLNYWETVYSLRNVDAWDTRKMSLLFMTGIAYYVTVRVFIPDHGNFDHNYVRFFHESVPTGFGMMVCFIFSIMIESLALRRRRRLRWYLIMVSFTLLMLSGVLIDSKVYRESLAFILLALQIFNLVSGRVIIMEKPATTA